MKNNEDYIKVNKELWNKKTEIHYTSEFYDNDNFIKGKNSLNEIELSLLGNIKGKSVLHLQCHFGQDTISLNRLGAKTTGVDFSEEAITKARELVKLTQSEADFICCDIYDLPQHLNKQYDIVYTSYGTIGWLPDMDKWAKIISRYLKPQGRFIFVDFHPTLWMFDDYFNKIEYHYFNTEAIKETEEGTYADKNASIKENSVSWNHPISEVVNNLLKNNIEITALNEYNYSPYNCFNELIEDEKGKFRVKHLGDKFPMVYAITAIKK